MSDERETTIGWYADEATATVYTSFRPMTTRLRRIRGAERVEVHRTEAGVWTGETWRVPVAYVLPHNVRVVRMSETERAVLAERGRRSMAALHKARGVRIATSAT